MDIGLTTVLSYVALLGLVGAVAAFVVLMIVSSVFKWPVRTRKSLLEPEYAYKTEEILPSMLNESPDKRPFFTPSKVYLSVVVPAMNEEARLEKMMDECLAYCQERNEKDSSFTYEVIIVDDGSRDNTADIGASYGKKYGSKVKVIKLGANRGKGGAVRVGVLHSQGKLVLFADADGATKFADIDRLEKEMIRSSGGIVDESFPGIVVGSRSHLEEQSKAERTLGRTILMHGFHFLVYLFTVRTVRDTQCGFKLFTRGAAAAIFPVLHVERWAFDVEVLYLAEKWNYSIEEVCVDWTEIDGSKITPIWSWLEMGRDLLLIWFRYAYGIWNDKPS